MKVWNYVVIFTAMILFLEFLGIPTGLSGTLSYFGININPTTHELITADLTSSNVYDYLFGGSGILIILAISGAVAIGILTRSFSENLVLLPFLTTILTLFISTGWTLINYVQSIGENWLTGIIAIIFIPLGVGYILACVEWFRGTD